MSNRLIFFLFFFNDILARPVPGSHAAEANWTDAVKRSAQPELNGIYIPALKLAAYRDTCSY